MNRVYQTAILIGVIFFITACGGGGGDSPPPTNTSPNVKTLSGTAAAGSPIAGKVNVKGSMGKFASSPIGIDGSFSLDVTALTAPYILYAEGSVNNKSISLYSIALTPGMINITQVTDFIVRNALAGSAESAYASWGTTTVTETALTTAAADVATMIDPLLSALGVSGTDFLTEPFVADSTGVDAALDALDISYSGSTATVTSTLTGSSFTDDITASGVSGSLPLSDTVATTTILNDQDAINAVWQIAIDLYGTTMPSESDLTAWFTNYVASDYLEDGRDRTTALNSWLTGEGPEVGFDIAAVIVSPKTVAGYVKAYQIRLIYTSSGTATFSTLMAYDGVNWRWYGNQLWVDATADAHAFTWVSASSSPTYESGFEFSINDDNNYAYNQGVRSALVTGPGLPAGGVVYAHLFPFTAENEFATYHSDGSTGGSFYTISSTYSLNDSAITSIPDNAVYTFELCTQTPAELLADTTLCSNEFSVTRTVPKPPLPVSSLDPGDFATLTSPTSHSLADFPIGTAFNVSWAKPVGTTSGEVGLSIDTIWISSDPALDDTTVTLDTVGVGAPIYFGGLFIRVEDVWGRDFNMGWDFYSGGSAPPVAVNPFDGTWVTNCVDVSSDTVTGSATWAEYNSGNAFTDIISIYDNATCLGTPIATKTGSGTGVLGNTLVTDSGYTANRLDWTITSTSQTGLINEVTDLVVGYTEGVTYYDIVLLLGDTIYYGDIPSTSSASRPTDVAFDFGFVKQM